MEWVPFTAPETRVTTRTTTAKDGRGVEGEGKKGELDAH
jgi:hypothetical protein